MNKEIKTKWVAALRSGKYKRGQRHLKIYGKYCCLGVLCEISEINYDPEGDYPPQSFTDEIGLSEQVMHILAHNNDGEAAENEVVKLPGYRKNVGLSFNKVADWIEENL